MDKIYLDTSIASAYFDTAKPLRQLITQKWFENESSNYDLYISNVVIDEIRKTRNLKKKESVEDLLIYHKVNILNLDQRAGELANHYIVFGAIPKKEIEDALHIAIATVNNILLLASWNFKHIVNINPIRKIHEINIKYDYPLIEIGSLEIFGGSKYGNL
ncbi:MAG: type II toxin-antitoxin system VapC family toxin [Nitrospinota bacterium]